MRATIVRRVTAASLLLGCSADAPGAGRDVEVRDSAGVTIVTRGGAPADTLVVGEPETVVGSAALDADERYAFQLVSDVAVVDDRIFIVDNRGGRVAVFDHAGTWLADVGRQGRGPGEHVAPIHIEPIGDTLFIWDAILRRSSRFTADGEFLGSTTVADRQAALPMVPVPAGWIDEIEWGQNVDPAPAGAAVVLRDSAGTVRDTLIGPYVVPEIGWEWTDDSQRSGMMVNPPVFSVRPPWTLRGDEILWAEPETGEIRVFAIGSRELRRLIRPASPGGSPTARDREAYVAALIARFDMDAARRAELLQNTTFAPQRPLIAALLVDDSGRTWLAGHDPAQFERGYVAAVWEVLDAEGHAISAVAFPADFELMRVVGARAYGVTRDADAVHTVSVYDVAGAR